MRLLETWRPRTRMKIACALHSLLKEIQELMVTIRPGRPCSSCWQIALAFRVNKLGPNGEPDGLDTAALLQGHIQATRYPGRPALHSGAAQAAGALHEASPNSVLKRRLYDV